MKIHCPMCHAQNEVPDDFEYRPFCSSTCKKIDLGNWLLGHYRSSRPLTPEEFSDLSLEEQSEVMQRALGGDDGLAQ